MKAILVSAVGLQDKCSNMHLAIGICIFELNIDAITVGTKKVSRDQLKHEI